MNDADTIRAFLADHDAACWVCGYNLRGNRDCMCPECGEEISTARLFGLHEGDLQPPDQLWEFGSMAFGVLRCLVPTAIVLLGFAGVSAIAGRPAMGAIVAAVWCLVIAGLSGVADARWQQLKPWFDRQPA